MFDSRAQCSDPIIIKCIPSVGHLSFDHKIYETRNTPEEVYELINKTKSYTYIRIGE